MKQITVGVLAHVDAGKTTLCEALLYTAGAIRRLGRVDHRDSLFDAHALERARGITIFSKQAPLTVGDVRVTLLDTPGHVDFSAETERTLPVLDCAVLVVSAPDGVQPHTETLWRLLRRYRVPTFLFVTKTDLLCRPNAALLAELRSRLSPACADCGGFAEGALPVPLQEELAALDEPLMERYLAGHPVGDADAAALIAEEKLFPCFFGSGLRLTGVKQLLRALAAWTPAPAYPEQFGARVYKITHDPQGVRLTHLKVTGGALRVRDTLSLPDRDGAPHTEKVTALRVYCGEKFHCEEALPAGSVCAAAGLEHSFAGQGLGFEPPLPAPVLEPVLTCRVALPEGCDPRALLPKLALLEEEDPLLRFVWDERLAEVHVRIMGEVQTEVLQSEIARRFGVAVGIDEGHVLYRETIAAPVEGVGHFEPLRHYAEVHLLLEPAPRGSGVLIAADCREEILAPNWQHLVLSNLAEKEHIGVLGGFPLTDVKLTLKSGRASVKHTEGGDFREAALRAVRQGLMRAESVLLEPVYRYRLALPTPLAGRAVNDIRAMGGSFEVAQQPDGSSLVTGRAPVAKMRGYGAAVASYTGGRGSLSCEADGFEPCRDAEAVLRARGYEPERDTANPPDSVFCRRGAGVTVKWSEVPQYMHLESILKPDKDAERPARRARDLDEAALQALFEREFGPIRRKQYGAPKQTAEEAAKADLAPRKQHLLVDGYNVLFAWEETAALAKQSLDLARRRLMDELADYRGFTGAEVVLVFDAYRSTDSAGKRFDHHGIEVLFTDTGESADAWLERLANDIGRDDTVRVVSSDNLVRLGALRSGVLRMSAKDLGEEVARVNARIADFIRKQNLPAGARIGDLLSEEELAAWRSKTSDPIS